MLSLMRNQFYIEWKYGSKHLQQIPNNKNKTGSIKQKVKNIREKRLQRV